jgi:hypothetical protein
MNRRDFLQALAVAGVAVAVPIKLVTTEIKDHKFSRRIEEGMDYRDVVALRVRGEFGEKHYVVVREIPQLSWVNMTSAQQEATWRRIEMTTLDVARMRGAA